MLRIIKSICNSTQHIYNQQAEINKDPLDFSAYQNLAITLHKAGLLTEALSAWDDLKRRALVGRGHQNSHWVNLNSHPIVPCTAAIHTRSRGCCFKCVRFCCSAESGLCRDHLKWFWLQVENAWLGTVGLMRSQVESGALSEADLLERALSSDCTHCARLWANLGGAHLRAGALTHAERACRTALRLGFQSSTVRRWLSDALDAQVRGARSSR
jgi:hypothetical protein